MHPFVNLVRVRQRFPSGHQQRIGSGTNIEANKWIHVSHPEPAGRGRRSQMCEKVLIVPENLQYATAYFVDPEFLWPKSRIVHPMWSMVDMIDGQWSMIDGQD